MNAKPKMSKGRKPAFTPQQVERMMHMRYTENLRCHEIASVMGVTKSTIERYTRRGTEIHTDPNRGNR
jgi:transposase